MVLKCRVARTVPDLFLLPDLEDNVVRDGRRLKQKYSDLETLSKEEFIFSVREDTAAFLFSVVGSFGV